MPRDTRETDAMLQFGVLRHIHDEAQPPAKHFYVGPDLQLHSAPNTGALTRSKYETAKVNCLADLAHWIEHEATAYQHLTQGVSQHDSALVLGRKDTDPKYDRAVTINRSNSDLPFRPSNGLMCIDTDSKVRELSFDDVWTGLCAAQPSLASYSVLHCSSSSSLVKYNGTCTGLKGSHSLFHVADATDIPRALDVLHVRACLAGYQTHRVSETGGFLARSIVDKALKTPSQPIYLRARVTPPVTQEKRVQLRQGAQEVLNTRAAIPDLTAQENAAYEAHIREHTARLQPEMDRVRAAYIEAKVAKLVAERGITEEQARKHVESALTGGILFEDWMIRVGNEWITVGQILAAPAQWHNVACYDPLDPQNTSATTAKIYTNKSPIISSFAHSGGDKPTAYKLMQSMRAADPADMAHLQLPMPSQETATVHPVDRTEGMSVDDTERTKEYAAEVEGYAAFLTTPDIIKIAVQYKLANDPRYQMMLDRAGVEKCLTAFRDEVKKEVRRVRNAERIAKEAASPNRRTDIVQADPNDYIYLAERLQNLAANRELAFSFGGNTVVLKKMQSAYGRVSERDAGGNKISDPLGNPITRPAQTTQARVAALGDYRVMAAKVGYFMSVEDGERVPAHIDPVLLQQFTNMPDVPYKAMVGIVQHPVVHEGRLLFGEDVFHQETGLFLKTGDLHAEEWTDAKAAYKFLSEDWLGDFAFKSDLDRAKALMMPASMLVSKTGMMNHAGPPIFLDTAPMPGSGKTLKTSVCHAAITGSPAPTLIYPAQNEEREKVIVASIMEGETALHFDNLKTGMQLGNSHAELATLTTSPIFKGRILGVSKTFSGPAGVVITLNGNNIIPAGDMASRIVHVRHDPDTRTSLATRKFRHTDLMQWTVDNRHRIIGALACILSQRIAVEPIGRFPQWSRLVADPILHVAGVDGFYDDWIEAAEADVAASGSAGFAALVERMFHIWPNQWVTGAEITAAINDTSQHALRSKVFGTSENVDGPEVVAYLRRNEGFVNEGVKLFIEKQNLGERTNRKKRYCFNFFKP